MGHHLAHFIPHFSDLTGPLRKLTKKNVRFPWGLEEEEAFKRIKAALSDCKTLEYYDLDLETEIIIDASPIGLAAILTQIKGEHRRIIEYASSSLTDTEARYSQTEREMLAVVYACEHFDMYLYGSDFTVITDQSPLIGIASKSMSKPTAHLERLCLRLQQYKIKLRYQPGRFNATDYLSRHPLKSKKSNRVFIRKGDCICLHCGV